MISFLCAFRPRSVNAKGAATYKAKVVEAYRKYYPQAGAVLNEDVYGISYYFSKCKHQLDADNLSKPIWDSLNKVVYSDDRIVKLRYSGIYDIGKLGTSMEIALGKMPANVYADFLEYIDKYDDIVYIEIGKLHDDLFVIGVER